MNYVSYKQLIEDVRAFAAALPREIVAVAGVPRSGIIPATLIALHHNIHLVTLEQLKQGEQPWRQPLRRGGQRKPDGPALVVDDSLASGATLQQTWEELAGCGRLLFAAVYYRAPHQRLLDFAFREVPAPRCFEWNLFHCQQMRYSCLDMDGVICEDWIHREEDEGPGLERYLQHLEQARPKHLPQSYPVQAIVTARLEKYRPQTEVWLKRHGVEYGELVMSPYPTAAARRAAGGTPQRKAEAYLSFPGSRLFLESDPRQSEQIARLTRRPVLCTRTMEMIGR